MNVNFACGTLFFLYVALETSQSKGISVLIAFYENYKTKITNSVHSSTAHAYYLPEIRYVLSVLNT